MLIKFLENDCKTIVEEILRTLCNISNTEAGKINLVQCNVIPSFVSLLKRYNDSDITKHVIACMANIATYDDAKENLAEGRCLYHALQIFQRAIDIKDNDVIKYSLYFLVNIRERYPEAARVLGSLFVMNHLSRFFRDWQHD